MVKVMEKTEERIKSGIKGLDKLITGGYEKGSLVLVSGGTGSGKTTYGLQFLKEGADNDEVGLYISFEEDESDLLKDAKSHGWDFDELMKKNKMIIKKYPPFAFDQFINDLDKIVERHKIKRMIIDSISAFGIYTKNPYELRKRIYDVSKIIKELGVTTIALSEIEGGGTSSGEVTSFSRFGVEEFVADALIILHYAGLGGEYDRSIQIIKMRRTDHKRGIFPMRIVKKGIEVSEGEN